MVLEKWLEFEPRLLAFAGKWDPGMVVAKHGHMCPNSIYVVEGSMVSDGVECTAGMNIMLSSAMPTRSAAKASVAVGVLRRMIVKIVKLPTRRMACRALGTAIA